MEAWALSRPGDESWMAVGMPARCGPCIRTQSEEEAVTKYLLIYQGEMEGPMPELSQEESDAMMQAWGDWMGRVGPALADGGAPTSERAAWAARAGRFRSPGTTSSTRTVSMRPSLVYDHPFLADAPPTSPSTSTS